MKANITTIHTEKGELPGVVFFRSWKYYYDGDIEGLIIAQREDDSKLGWQDFVEPDPERARERLRETALALYPECEILYD